jgi:predicted AAA+ superfamily ATPase
MEREYLSRVADKELDTVLAAFGAVLIEGPKWCGKTWTAEKRAASKIYLQDIGRREEYLETAKIAPNILLNGDAPRLIDEWQTIPILWDGVRFEVDQRRKKGQFILTGSAVSSDNSTMHTGTGRIARLLMRPMSLFESMESNGEVSLRSIFNGEDIAGTSPLTLERLAFSLVRGGWPASVREEDPVALRHAREYVKSIVNSDISHVDGVERNPGRVRKLMRSLARNLATPVKKGTIMSDISSSGGDYSISDKTFTSYVNALRRIYVLETQPAWGPSIRSRTTIRTSSKCHFVDPSVAAVLLRTSPQGLMQDFKTFGFLFESLCIRDLRIYAQAMEGEVSYYRDGTGLEADAIIHLYDGRWGAVEVKMGAGSVEEAAENLKKLSGKIDHEEMGKPSFLMVLTATSYAYRREDGVYVVPIGCLRD